MNAFLRRTLFSEPTGPVPGFRYVALTFIVGLLVCSIALAATERHPSIDRALLSVLALSLLLQHLTSQFRWHWNIFVTLRSLYFVASGVSRWLCCTVDPRAGRRGEAETATGPVSATRHSHRSGHYT